MDVVEQVRVEVRRDEPRSHPLEIVDSGLAAGEDGVVARLDRVDPHVGERLAEPAPDSGKGVPPVPTPATKASTVRSST